MKLILTPHGTAELVNTFNQTLWASDDDPDFLEEFDGDDFVREEDVDDILDYLVEIEQLEPDEADAIDVEVQSLDDEDSDDSDDDEVDWPGVLDG